MADEELGNNTGDDEEAGAPVEAPPKPKAKRVSSPKVKDRVRIQLEESDEIPPNGLFLGLNGKGHILRAGEPADVPIGIVDILEHAVMSVPVVDPQTKQVVGYRDRLRYPFRKL